jgi:hypothetical protein
MLVTQAGVGVDMAQYQLNLDKLNECGVCSFDAVGNSRQAIPVHDYRKFFVGAKLK